MKDKQIWRIVAHYGEEELKKADHSDINFVGVDETSQRKGHNYITVFADINTGLIIFIINGKDASTLASFCNALKTTTGLQSRSKISVVTCLLLLLRVLASNFH